MIWHKDAKKELVSRNRVLGILLQFYKGVSLPFAISILFVSLSISLFFGPSLIFLSSFVSNIFTMFLGDSNLHKFS